MATHGKWEHALEVGGRLAESDGAGAELLLAVAKAVAQLGDVTRAKGWLGRAIALNQTPEFRLRVLDDSLLTTVWKQGGKPA